jgi:hypothetical protein
MMLLALSCSQFACGVEEEFTGRIGTNAEEQLSGRLKIYRATLLQGANEQIRIEAAIELLLAEEKQARQILLDALIQQQNPTARAAVCRALSQSRSWHKSIKDKDDFIKPLFSILESQSKQEAQLAAEGLLIFEYRQISRYIEEMIADTDTPYNARLNAIYALRLRPERESIFELIKLRDHSDRGIAATAEKELQELLGIPIGADEWTWEQIRKELQRKSRYEFIRDRLVRQEAEARKLKAEMEQWQRLYVTAIEKLYQNLPDENARAAFLVEHLGSEQCEVKLWAIEKIRQWRLGGALPSEVFGASLLRLISDGDRKIRLKTAQLLALMGNLSSTEQLLAQLKTEQDQDVAIELLVALGEACYYAFLPNSGIKVSQEIRMETFELAADYLSQADAKKAEVGATILGKLLQQEGLKKEEVVRYLSLLAERSAKAKSDSQNSLHGQLLNVMARLCGDGSYRSEAAKLFEPVFLANLDNKSVLVKEAAVTGLINIDKIRALAVLTDEKKGLINDESLVVRTTLMELAGSVGGREQLVWLSMKLNVNGEREPAWQAMRQIFKRCDVEVAYEWINGFFDHTDKNSKPSQEEMIYLLEMAEQKAAAENKTDILRNLRIKLADHYGQTEQFEKAAKYLGMLLEGTDQSGQRDDILACLVDVQLRAGWFPAATDLVANRLLEKDLPADDAVMLEIGRFLAGSENATNKKELLKALESIETTQARPMWTAQLKLWRKQFGILDTNREPNKPARPGNEPGFNRDNMNTIEVLGQ